MQHLLNLYLTDLGREPDFIYQLRPIRQEFVPASFAMSRNGSITSSFVSDRSSNPSSRSTSPISICREPVYARSPPSHRIALNTSSFAPYPQPQLLTGLDSRCPSCLEIGENVFLTAEKTCPRCGHADSKRTSIGKAGRRKRSDRHRFSRLTNHDGEADKASKEEGEGGRRYDHSVCFARLQNQILEINSALPETAASVDRKKNKTGWTPLKGNNVSEDVLEKSGIAPLRYNKTNIFASALQVNQDSNAIIYDAIHEQIQNQNEAEGLIRRNASHDEMKRFLDRFVRKDWAEMLAVSSSQRGAEDFTRPSQPRSKL